MARTHDESTPLRFGADAAHDKQALAANEVQTIDVQTIDDRKVPKEDPCSNLSPSRKVNIFEFADSEAMKEKVRKSILKPDPYNVHDFYYKTGLWQRIARHPYFENGTLAVITANAIWIWVDTDFNKSDSLLKADWIFQLAEQLFCIYFSFEWVVRFMAFERKYNGCWDAWFVFDSLLVFMMVMETWVFTLVEVASDSGGSPLGGQTAILRLFRLMRLSRLMRMLRSFSQLMVLIKGMITAMKSVFYVMCLLIIIMYVFAIALTQLSTGQNMYGEDKIIHERYFSNVQESMYSLLIYGTFLDNLADFCNDVRYDDAVCLVLVMLFIGLACLTVLNMLIGVLCEIVSAVAETETEELRTITVSEKMREVVSQLDTDQDRHISYNEFRRILEFPKALQALEEVGVDPVGIVDFADLFFIRDGETIELPFDRFMELVLDLRGSKQATVKDVMNLWKQMSPKLNSMSDGLTEICYKMKEVRTELDSMHEQDAKIQERVRAILDKVRE